MLEERDSQKKARQSLAAVESRLDRGGPQQRLKTPMPHLPVQMATMEG
jgi:hypothetical protein